MLMLMLMPVISVPLSRRRLRAVAAATGSSPRCHRGRTGRLLGGLVALHASPARTNTAPQKSEHDEAAHRRRHGNDDVLVLLEPVAHVIAERSSTAHAVIATTAVVAGRAVEEILVQSPAIVGVEGIGRAAQELTTLLAGRRLVVGVARADGRLTLLVAGGALARGALQVVAVAAGVAVA